MCQRDEGHTRDKELFCPSAHPKLKNSLLIGVVADENGSRIRYLDRPIKVPEGTILALSDENINPTAMFRFAAPCSKEGCEMWSGTNCRVVERLVQIMPAVTENLPQCKLRPVCRWYAERGASACRACPQVITYDKELTARMNGVPEVLPISSSTGKTIKRPGVEP